MAQHVEGTSCGNPHAAKAAHVLALTAVPLVRDSRCRRRVIPLALPTGVSFGGHATGPGAALAARFSASRWRAVRRPSFEGR